MCVTSLEKVIGSIGLSHCGILNQEMSLESHKGDGKRVHGDSLVSINTIPAEGMDVNPQGSVELWNCQKSTGWFLHRQRGSNLKLGESMGGRYVLAFFLLFSVRQILARPWKGFS